MQLVVVLVFVALELMIIVLFLALVPAVAAVAVEEVFGMSLVQCFVVLNSYFAASVLLKRFFLQVLRLLSLF